MGRVQTRVWTRRAGDDDDGDGEFFIWGAHKPGLAEFRFEQLSVIGVGPGGEQRMECATSETTATMPI
jgi:hypothetical protein